MKVYGWHVQGYRGISLLLVACLIVGMLPGAPVAAAGLANVSQSASPTALSPMTIAEAVGQRAERAGRPLAYHVLSTPAKAGNTATPITTAVGPIQTHIPTAQVSILGAWQNPNQVLLRWVPQGEWIPESGYSLYRVANGKRTELAAGLGRSDQATLTMVDRDRLAGQLQSLGQHLAAAPAPEVASNEWVEGPLVASQDDLGALAGDLRSQVRLSDNAREALLAKGLITSTTSAAEAEKALYKLNAQPKLQPNQVVSGQTRFNEHLLQALQNQAPGPAIPVSLNGVRPPVLLNKQITASQAASSSNPAAIGLALSPALLPTALTEISATDALLQARHDLISLANVRFELALVAGLAFVDQLEMGQFKTGDSLTYELVPTPTAGSTPNPLVRAKVTVKVGVEERPTPPTAMQGYGMDGRVYLRWDLAKDEYTKKVLSGYVIERRKESGEFEALNPYSPAVISYSADEKGVLYEQAAFFTDDGSKGRQEHFRDGDRLYYRVYGVDIFGRRTPSSQPIDIDVIKTLPPVAPSVRQPVLSTATSGSRFSLNSETLPVSARSTASGLPRLLPTALSPGIERSGESISTQTLSPAVVNQGLYATQLNDEVAAQMALALRMQTIRDLHPGKTGIFVPFSHSLQVQASRQTAPETPQISRDLVEYRVYRSEAEGTGRFTDPKLVKTISLQDAELYVPKANPKNDILYYDTDVKPGRFYAYWVTACDSWGNESSCSEPRTVGYPTPLAPAAPAPVKGSFAVNQALFARERIPGFFQRYLPVPGPSSSGAPITGASLLKDQITGVLPSTTTPSAIAVGPAAELKVAPTSFDPNKIQAVVVVGYDEVLPDGSVNVSWHPDANSDTAGYSLYRTLDPATSAATADTDTILASANRLFYIRVKAGLQETHFRDRITPRPQSGCIYYIVMRETKATTGTESGPSPQPGGHVTLSWTASTDPQVAGYRIYRAEIPRDTAEKLEANPASVPTRWEQQLSWQLVADGVKAATYTEAVPQSLVHYFRYRVAAVTVWGVESAVAAVTPTIRIPTTVPPAVPPLLTPIAGPGQVLLRWKPVSEATRYNIYRSAKPLPILELADWESALAKIGKLTSAATSSPSSSTPTQSAGSAPAVRTARATRIRQSIDSLSTADQLKIYQNIRDEHGVLALTPYGRLDLASAKGIQWLPYHTVDISYLENEQKLRDGSTVTWVDDKASYPQTYLYTVEAVNVRDKLPSDRSEPISGTPQKGKGEAAPTPVSARWTNAGVQLSWPEYNHPDLVGYLVFRATSSAGDYEQCSPLLDSPTFIDTATAGGMTYWYKVVIIDEAGLLSAASLPVSCAVPGFGSNISVPPIKVPDLKLPQLPTIPRTLPDLKLSYRLSPLVIDRTPMGMSATSTALPPIKPPIIPPIIPPIDPPKEEPPTPVLPPVIVLPPIIKPPILPTPTLPAAPTNLRAVTTTSTSVALTWDAPRVAPTGYRVYGVVRSATSVAPPAPTLLGTTLTPSVEIPNLKPKTTYLLTVKSYTALGESPASSPLSVTTPATPLPTTMTISGYTVEGLTCTDLAASELICTGKINLPDLAPIPVKVKITTYTGQVITNGSVQLLSAYSQPLGPATLELSALSVSTSKAGATLTGRLSVPGLEVNGTNRGLPFVDAELSSDGTLTLPTTTSVHIGDYTLKGATTISVGLNPSQRQITLRGGTMETAFGQLTKANERFQFRFTEVRIDFQGKLSGTFHAVPWTSVNLAIPVGMELQLASASLELLDNEVIAEKSKVDAKLMLPFARGEIISLSGTDLFKQPIQGIASLGTTTVSPPTRANFPATGRLNVASLARQSGSSKLVVLDDNSRQLVAASLGYALNLGKVAAKVNLAPVDPLNRGTISFQIATWDGTGFLPTADQTGALLPILLEEIDQASSSEAKPEQRPVIELSAQELTVQLLPREPRSEAEWIGHNAPSYIGFTIERGAGFLPSDYIRPKDPSQKTKFKLDVQGGTISYDRVGLRGRADNEASSVSEVPVLLNNAVDAVVTKAGIELYRNQAVVDVDGRIHAANLQRDLLFHAFTDPKTESLIFSLLREKEQSIITVTGGQLIGSDLHIDGVSVIQHQELNTSVEFIDLTFRAPVVHGNEATGATQVAAYGFALAAKPVHADFHSFDMEIRCLRFTDEGDLRLLGAVKLADDIPVNMNLEDDEIRLRQAITSAAPQVTSSAKLDYHYQELVKIKGSLGFDGQEYRDQGDGRFWFTIGSDPEQPLGGVKGNVKVRIGANEYSYWVMKFDLPERIPLGPLQLDTSFSGMAGYNVAIPGADGAISVPSGWSDGSFASWGKQNNGRSFFVAQTPLHLMVGVETLFTLDPVRLVIEPGPALTMDAAVIWEGKAIAFGSIGYYHPEHRFSAVLTVPEMSLPVFPQYTVSGSMSFGVGPDYWAIALGYPELVTVGLPISGLPCEFGAGFGYEYDQGRNTLKMRAMASVDTGDVTLGIVYIRAYIRADGEIILELPSDFQMTLHIQGGAEGGVKLRGRRFRVIRMGLDLLGQGVKNGDSLRVSGNARVYWSVDLWLLEVDGSVNWNMSMDL